MRKIKYKLNSKCAITSIQCIGESIMLKHLLLAIHILLGFYITCADRHARRSGVRPKALNSRTLCCVGLVFYKKEKKNNVRFPAPATICQDRRLEKCNADFFSPPHVRIEDVISRIRYCRHRKIYLPAHQLHPIREQG